VNARLDRQVEALVARLRDEAAARRRELQRAAETECERLAREARSEAHARVRAAATAKRLRVAERCRTAVALAESAARATGFERARAQLAETRAALHAGLVARWREPPARERWWRGAVATAGRRLRSRRWRIELAAEPPLATEERERLAAAASTHGAATEFALADGAPAGLRIVAESATGDAVTRTVLDATPEGLMHDAQALDARLLAALESGA
jgi:hypothetical protein